MLDSMFETIFSPNLINYLVTLVVAITFHEFARAKTAGLPGEITPLVHWRVTLTPLSRLNTIGSVMILIFILSVGPNLGFDDLGSFVYPPVATLFYLLLG